MATVSVQYFAVFREQRGLGSEEISTSCTTAGDLFEELRAAHGFTIAPALVKVAIDGAFASMETPLHDGAVLVFIPPVAGG